MSSQVFAISLRTHFKENMSDKLLRLFEALKPEKVISSREKWAVKIHFGERGNHAFIRPHLVRAFVERIKKASAMAFITDTNTLYVGYRANSIDHLETALLNGFNLVSCGAPLIIADGLTGENQVAVPLKNCRLEKAYIAGDIISADGVLALTHFKGHEMTGFGGALKNMAMGAASRRGKMEQHSGLGPKVKNKACVGCKRCLSFCAHGAISMTEAKKAKIDPQKCVGCAGCIPVCPQNAIDIHQHSEGVEFMEKMIEYAYASLIGKEKKRLFVNFLTQVSPLCDCYSHTDAPITADLGVLASYDPVALDQASADLVNQAPGLPGSALKEALEPGGDKWRALHPKCDWEYQLDYAEKLGLGKRAYKLNWLPEFKGVK